MKTYTSVASLAIKLTWKRTVLVFAAVGAAQLLTARNSLMPGGVPIAMGLAFEQLLNEVQIWGLLGFLALVLALTFSGQETRGVRSLYTLRRLSVGRGWIPGLFSLVFTGYFLVYWVFQLGMAMGLFAWYSRLLAPGPNALMLAVWRSDWFHLLLPLQEWSGYLRNGAICVSFGTCAALGAHRMRCGRNYIAALIPVAIAAFNLESTQPGMLVSDIAKTVLMLAVTAIFAWFVRGGTKDEEIL